MMNDKKLKIPARDLRSNMTDTDIGFLTIHPFKRSDGEINGRCNLLFF